MVGHFSQFLPPPEALKILTVLLLSFLIGLEREEHKANGDYSFGGVRTFPLIGLVGYAVALLSKDQLMPLAIGFAVIGAFLRRPTDINYLQVRYWPNLLALPLKSRA